MPAQKVKLNSRVKPKDYKLLVVRAKKEDISVSELVRGLVEKDNAAYLEAKQLIKR